MFLADLPAPNAAEFSGFINSFAAIAVLALVILKIIDHFKRKPSIDVEFVTRAEFNKHVDQVNHRLELMSADALVGRRNLHKDIEHAVEKINDRIGEFSVDIANRVGELRGELKRMQ